jgi:hypothetical protein
MVAEAIVAALLGLAGLYLVLQPLFRPSKTSSAAAEPLDPEETPRGVALAALKEIDFDRETGKLSEDDYQFLKAKYTGIALEALRVEREGVSPESIEAMVAARVRALRASGGGGPQCAVCGPRPEPDADFCSTCGLELASAALSRLRSNSSVDHPFGSRSAPGYR